MLLKLDPNYKCQNGCFQNGKNPTDFNLNKILNRAGSKKSACHKAAPHECTLLADSRPMDIILHCLITVIGKIDFIAMKKKTGHSSEPR